MTTYEVISLIMDALALIATIGVSHRTSPIPPQEE